MNVDTFAAYAQSRQFQVVGELAVGLIGNYPASMVYRKINMVSQVTIIIPLEKGQSELIKKSLRTKLHRKAQVVAAPETISFVVVVKDKTIDDILDEVQAVVVAELRESNVAVPEVCPICSRPGCDVYARVKDIYRPAHSSCVKNQVASTQEKAEESLQGGNYLTGILGAFLGAIVGGIPSVLTILLTESIFSILYALIPLCAYKGYQLCKGKMNAAVLPITIVFSVIGAVLVDIISVFVQIYTEYGAVPMRLVSRLFGNSEFQAALMKDITSSLVFVALGVWISWGYIRRNANTTLEDVYGVQNTMIPIQRQGQDNYQR